MTTVDNDETYVVTPWLDVERAIDDGATVRFMTLFDYIKTEPNYLQRIYIVVPQPPD